ncbi:MAG: anthranilate phosphoribosyltransferase [Bacteroidales bacterium]|nr:anthranilate phosphoribosyltransferase [Bacteroidales bacterium]
MKQILNSLYEYQPLSSDDAAKVLSGIIHNQYPPAQIAAFLSIFNLRPPGLNEIEGFVKALSSSSIPINLDDYELIDVCGTGGDGKNTFNISTLTSFVLAGAGFKVAKHGNYGSSSPVGSSNLLEFLGYRFSNDESKLKREIETTGICYLHAPLFQPALKNIAAIRRELSTKSFFNILGPMINPAKPKNQLIGVMNHETARIYQYLYQKKAVNYNIVYSLDGYDEISLTAPFKLFNKNGEQLIYPEHIGMKQIDSKALLGGSTIKESTEIFLSILKNEGSKAQQDVVIANAAFAIQTQSAELSILEALAKASESLESGRAYRSFVKLMQLNS